MKRTFQALPALLLVAFVAGCGSSSDTTTTTTTKPPANARNVAVILNEMNVIPDRSSAPAGKLTFNAKNQGKIGHELVILRTDKPADALGSGTTVPETGLVKDTGEIAAGGEKRLFVDLKPGHYALICNLPGHYSAGMHADFTVN